MSMHEDVKKFLDACDQYPSEKNVQLYEDLISEEYSEFIEAYEKNDDVEQLDACMDMIWVILGYCHMKGFDVQGAWDEVARSNLSKIQSNGKVLKNENGKVQKPANWSPPNLHPFVK